MSTPPDALIEVLNAAQANTNDVPGDVDVSEKKKRNRSIKKASELVAPNTLQKGSYWSSFDHDVRELIEGAVAAKFSMTAIDHVDCFHVVTRSNDHYIDKEEKWIAGRLVIQCTSCDKKHNPAYDKKNKNCPFFVKCTANDKTNPGTWLILDCALNHTCGLTFGRNKNVAPSKIVTHAPSLHVITSYKQKSVASGDKTGDSASLTALLHRNHIQVSRYQSTTLLSSRNSTSIVDHIKEYMILPSLLQELKKHDPKGCYEAEFAPLSYDVEGVPRNSGALQFVRLTVIPSALMNLFTYSAKICSLDAAHLTCRFGGSLMLTAGKTGANKNLPRQLTICGRENKLNWQYHARNGLKYLGMILLAELLQSSTKFCVLFPNQARLICSYPIGIRAWNASKSIMAATQIAI